jgi:hypothetical protein
MSSSFPMSGRVDSAGGKVTGENYRICGRRRAIRRTVLLFTAFLLLTASNASHAPERDGIVGSWNTEEHDAIIEIFNCGQKYCGRIKWLREPCYTADDGTAGRAGRRSATRIRIRNSGAVPSSAPRFCMTFPKRVGTSGTEGRSTTRKTERPTRAR